MFFPKAFFHKAFLSNTFLALGILLLGAFAIYTARGMTIDPLVPALAAACVAGAGLLDRLDSHKAE